MLNANTTRYATTVAEAIAQNAFMAVSREMLAPFRKLHWLGASHPLVGRVASQRMCAWSANELAMASRMQRSLAMSKQGQVVNAADLAGVTGGAPGYGSSYEERYDHLRAAYRQGPYAVQQAMSDVSGLGPATGSPFPPSYFR